MFLVYVNNVSVIEGFGGGGGGILHIFQNVVSLFNPESM